MLFPFYRWRTKIQRHLYKKAGTNLKQQSRNYAFHVYLHVSIESESLSNLFGNLENKLFQQSYSTNCAGNIG